MAVLGGTAWGAEAVAVDIVAPGFVPAGELFTIDVTLGPVTALDAARLVVTYDPSLVAHVDAGRSLLGVFADASLFQVDSPSEDTTVARVNFAGTAGVSGDGPFVRLTFRALVRGSARISLSSALLVDGAARDMPTVLGPPAWVDVGVAPSFEKRNHWVFDPAPGGNRDSAANPGERLQLQVRLRNSGTGAARGVQVAVTVEDPAVTATAAEAARVTWSPGEARNSTFVLRIATAAAPSDVTFTVDVTADNGGPWRHVFVLPIVHPPVFFEHRNDWVFDPAPLANQDAVANPGERIRPRLRLVTSGTDPAQNALVTLTVSDPTVTVVSGEVRHATWPAGEARNNEGFLLDIAPDANSREVALTARVDADNGGPWFFSFAIVVVAIPVEFSYRSHWTFDPGGNRDGHANPGERVRPRVRLRNDGPGVGRNVRVSLAISDGDVTVVDGEIVHAIWPAGEAQQRRPCSVCPPQRDRAHGDGHGPCHRRYRWAVDVHDRHSHRGPRSGVFTTRVLGV